jgi:hypothetical protein
MNKKISLEERAKQKGKTLLIESISYLPNIEDVKVETKLIEAITGKQHECRGVLKNVPVTRFTENANGRIYPKELWAEVEKRKTFEGADCLADHAAEGDGSVLDTVGIWKNFKVGEDIATADLYCIGAAGNLLLEKARAGGKVGFSTVAFGTLSESDNKTVMTEDFEFENCDWVRKPSQNVFATQENLEESIKESVEIKKENKIIENNFTNNYKEEKTVEVKQMDKFSESTFKNLIRATIKEANANENYVEAIEELKEVSKTIPSEMVEQIAQVDTAITQIQSKLHEQKEQAQKELKESKETLESMTKKYEASCNTIKVLKENLEKASKIVEKVNDKDTVKTIKLMSEDLDQFESDRKLMESDIKKFIESIEALKEDVKLMSEDIKCFEEDTILRDKDIARFKEERGKMKNKNSKLSKQLKVAERHIKRLEKTLKEEFDYEFDDEIVDDEFVDDTMIIDDEFVDESDIDDVFADEDDFYMESEDEDEEDEMEEDSDDADEISDGALEESDDEDEDEEDEDELEESDDDDEDEEDEELEEEEDDEEESDDDKMAAVRDAKKEALRRKKRLQVKKLEAKKASKKKSVKESKAPVKEVVEYYKAISKTKPAIRDIKEAVLKSRSLLEAVKKVSMFEHKFGNDVHKLKESAQSNKQEFTKYKFTV